MIYIATHEQYEFAKKTSFFLTFCRVKQTSFVGRSNYRKGFGRAITLHIFNPHGESVQLHFPDKHFEGADDEQTHYTFLCTELF